MTELKLEVGKTYLDRKGDKVQIEKNPGNKLFPFSCGAKTYRLDGSFLNEGDDARDLVSEYVEPTPAAARTPHKWAKEMHAFADGYEIQGRWLCYNREQDWVLNNNPHWNAEREFRIKPEPAPLLPNVIRYIPLLEDGNLSSQTYDAYELSPIIVSCTKLPVIRIEFNPNDQTLVSASVVTL